MKSFKNFLACIPLNEKLNLSLYESNDEKTIWDVCIHAHSRLISCGKYKIHSDARYIFIEFDPARTDILHASKEDLEQNPEEIIRKIPSLTPSTIEYIIKNVRYHHAYNYGDGIVINI